MLASFNKQKIPIIMTQVGFNNFDLLQCFTLQSYIRDCHLASVVWDLFHCGFHCGAHNSETVDWLALQVFAGSSETGCPGETTHNCGFLSPILQ